MAEKDDKSKKETKKEATKVEPEVNPRKKAAKNKETEKAPETKKVEETKKKEEEVPKDTKTTIENNNGAVDTAPKSVKKKKKNGLVIFLTIVVILLIAAIGFFAVLYYTDSDLLKGDTTSNSSNNSSSNKSKSKDKLVAIDSDLFEEAFDLPNWTVVDNTPYINTSEQTEKEYFIAVEDGSVSSAIYTLYGNEKDAKQAYEDTVERIEDIFKSSLGDISKEETSGKNWEKCVLQNKASKDGYGVIIRVDDTVFGITTDNSEKSTREIMEKLGYK